MFFGEKKEKEKEQRNGLTSYLVEYKDISTDFFFK